MRAEVSALAGDLEAFGVVWQTHAQSELHERDLFAQRRTLADAVRARHQAVAAALDAASTRPAPFVEPSEDREASPPTHGDAVAVSQPNVSEESRPQAGEVLAPAPHDEVGPTEAEPVAAVAERVVAVGETALATAVGGTPLAMAELTTPEVVSTEAAPATHEPTAPPVDPVAGLRSRPMVPVPSSVASVAEPAATAASVAEPAASVALPVATVATVAEPAATVASVAEPEPPVLTDAESAPPVAAPAPTVPADLSASEDRDTFWILLARGDESGAYVLARQLEQRGGEPPIAPEIIAALQASRWFDGDTMVFAGDIAELVRRTTVDGDQRTILLAAAAALVPVLVAPEANLRAWLDARVPTALAALAAAVTRFADRAQQRLDRVWIDGVVDAGEQRRSAESLRAQAQRLLTEAPHRRTKYQAGTVLWQQYFRLELKPVLERIAAGDEAVIGHAEHLVRRIASAAALTEELNRLDRKLRPGIGDEIDYGAREQLNSHVREVTAAIDAWAQQLRTLMRCREGTWMATQVAELRNGVAGTIGDARRYASELVSSGSLALQACGVALGTTMQHLATVLRLPVGEAAARALPELDALAVRLRLARARTRAAMAVVRRRRRGGGVPRVAGTASRCLAAPAVDRGDVRGMESTPSLRRGRRVVLPPR